MMKEDKCSENSTICSGSWAKFYPGHLIGINLFRLLAVFLMFITHSFRLQDSFHDVYKTPELSTWADDLLKFFMKIEPLTSAIFLFIAGFSVALSWVNHQEPRGRGKGIPWVFRNGSRLMSLYAIAMIMFVATNGFQWVHLFFSPGILSVIAVSILVTRVLMVTPLPWLSLLAGMMGVIYLSLVLDLTKVYIAGLNSGAGGIVPLLGLAFSGAFSALIYVRFGLKVLLLLSIAFVLVSVMSLLLDYPWVLKHTVVFFHYGFSPVDALWGSLLDLFGLFEGEVREAELRFWNHSSVFIMRALGPISVLLCLLLWLFSEKNTGRREVDDKTKNDLTSVGGRSIQGLNWLGQHALTLYVYHLVFLAVLEVIGFKPLTGSQTWILVGIISLFCPLVIILISQVEALWRRRCQKKEELSA